MPDSIRRTVTVQFVNQPKPGRKFGSIKVENGDYISVSPEKLAYFQKGAQVDISYVITEQGYLNLKEIHSAPPSNGAPTRMGSSRGAGAPDIVMFVTGVVGRAMQSGKFDASDIRRLTEYAHEAFSYTVEGKAQTRHIVPPSAPARAIGNGSSVGQAAQRIVQETQDPRLDQRLAQRMSQSPGGYGYQLPPQEEGPEEPPPFNDDIPF